MSRTAALPRCCASHRLAPLDMVDAMLLNDVRATYDQMVETGWAPPAVLESVRADYGSWLLGRLAGAIELGVDLIELEVSA